jgi:hypothetical protein
MMKIVNWIKNNPNRSMFLIPIILVAVISISHVVTWYDIANPLNWAIYLSVAIEIAAMTALVAVSTRVKGGVWFMFSLVTLIQVIGNVFFCFKEIDENGELFQSWVELTLPIWDLMGTDVSDTVGMKRWLALLEGGLLPIISLTSLHFFVNYEKKEELNEIEKISEDYVNEKLTEEKEIEVNTGIVDKKGEEVKLTKPTPNKSVKVDTPFGKVNKTTPVRKDIGNSGSKNIQRID